MKKCILTFALLFYVLIFGTSCSQFAEIFNPPGQTSYKVAKKDTEQTHENSYVEKSSDKKESKKSKYLTPYDSNASSESRQVIITSKGTYYFVNRGDTLNSIAQKYKIKKEELAQINDLYDSELVIGRRIFIPNKKTKKEFLSVTQNYKKEHLENKTKSQKLKFAWPVKQYRITSKFGWRRGRPHDGVDLSAKRGTPIIAAAEGKVIFAKKFSGYGNLIVVKHTDNYFSAYAHAQTILVPKGKTVKRGEKIATIGTTGRSTGPHLHFEIHKGEKAIDPLTMLPQ